MTDDPEQQRLVRCKKYHEDHGAEDPGLRRDAGDTKSRCPGWTRDAQLRQTLLESALVEDPDDTDSMGRPRRLWNALNGWYFVAISTNEPVPGYNCYPEVPATRLKAHLDRLAERTIEEVMAPQDE